MLFGTRAEGAGVQLFGYTTLITELWLLGSGLDDVFVGRSGKPLHLRLLYGNSSVPENSAESSVFHRVIMSNEMSNLDGILVMQNKLRVSYCNGFIGARTPVSYWKV